MRYQLLAGLLAGGGLGLVGMGGAVQAGEERPLECLEVHEIGFVDANRSGSLAGWLSSVPPGTPVRGQTQWRAQRTAVDGAIAAGTAATPRMSGRTTNTPAGGTGTAPRRAAPAAAPAPPNRSGDAAFSNRRRPSRWTRTPASGDGGRSTPGRPAGRDEDVGQVGRPRRATPATAGRTRRTEQRERRRTGGTEAIPMDPLLFFYSTRPVEVDVRAGFRNGVPVAWWPGGVVDGRAIRFDRVAVAPGAVARPHAAALDTARWPGLVPLQLARAVGASPVRVGRDVEGSLAYEGAMPVSPRLTVRRGDGDVLVLTNGEPFAFEGVIVLPEGDAARGIAVGSVPAGATITVPLAAEQRVALRLAVDHLLRPTGLFPKEIAALRGCVLDGAFLRAPGVRVLARYPRAEWDRVVPLQIRPAPRQLIRVGVLRLFDALHHRPSATTPIPLPAATTGAATSGRGPAPAGGVSAR